MPRTWEEQFVDEQVERAWLEFRVKFADWCVTSLDDLSLHRVFIDVPTGDFIEIVIDEEVDVYFDDEHHDGTNVDAMALLVAATLRERFGVVHPDFLEYSTYGSMLEDQFEGPTPSSLPLLGHASSTTELQHWVRTALENHVGGSLRVQEDGQIGFTSDSAAVSVIVRDAAQLEVWSRLAADVDRKKARKVMARLSSRHIGVSIHLSRGDLIVSRLVDAAPFVPEHMINAIGTLFDLTEKLSWVTELLDDTCPPDADEGVPAGLVELVASAHRLTRVQLTLAVKESTEDSPTVLRRWRKVVRREGRRLQHVTEKHTQGVDLHLAKSWSRVEKAMDEVTAEQEAETFHRE